MRLRISNWLFALAFTAGALGCSAPRPNMATPAPESVNTNDDGFSLILNNRHYLDVNVFLYHDGQSSRVGTVTGSSSASLMVPQWMLGKGGVIRLTADPIGGLSSYTTDNLVIQPGQIVELNIESEIRRSNYSVQ